MWNACHLNVPGELTNCPEVFAWPSVQTGSSPVNHSCSTSHVTGGCSDIREPVRRLVRPVFALKGIPEETVLP